MARSRKSSPAELIVEVASLLPWWACIGLALVSYVALHAYAISSVASIEPGKVATTMVPMVLKGLATAGQYILPILFAFAAVLSIFNRSKSKAIQQSAGTDKSAKIATISSTPSCPVCSSPMKMRKAMRGSNAGNAFWGCSNYPQCKGTRAAE